MSQTQGSPPLTRALLLVLSASAGLSVANIYYNQPMVGLMGADLGRLASQVPTATQLGYALGLVLLVPLGDCTERRRLILLQVAGLVAALVAAASLHGAVPILAASAAVGVAATIAQQILPLAAELSPPETRGRTVGTVMSGLLCGILLARTLSGVVAEHLGWQAMFWVGAAIAAAMGAMLRFALPRVPPTQSVPYGRLLASLAGLVRAHPALRRSALVQAGLFGGFSAFWSTLALLLQTPRFGLGSEAAGLFGVVGLAGVACAPLAGRLADRHGPAGVVRLGVALVLAAFAILAGFPTLAGLTAGVIVLDAGVQLSMIANQTVVLGLDPATRGRMNTVFVASLFGGGAFGSAAGGLAWHAWGWNAVAGLGFAMALASLAVQLAIRVPAQAVPAQAATGRAESALAVPEQAVPEQALPGRAVTERSVGGPAEGGGATAPGRRG